MNNINCCNLTPDNIRRVSVEALFEQLRFCDYQTKDHEHKLGGNIAFIEIRRRLVLLTESVEVLTAFRDRINTMIIDIAPAEYRGQDLTNSVRKEIENPRAALTEVHEFIEHAEFDFANGNTDESGTVDEGNVLGYRALNRLDKQIHEALHLPAPEVRMNH
jgi:hypothetical protein